MNVGKVAMVRYEGGGGVVRAFRVSSLSQLAYDMFGLELLVYVSHAYWPYDYS